jgi:hypothetical protein
MTYPECATSFDSRVPDGRIVHRVCLNSECPTYHMAVSCGACTLCQSDEASPLPNALLRAYSYAEALIRWGKAHRPVRQDDEVTQLYDTFCASCKQLHNGKTCSACGCRVASAGWAIRNKIKMATEHCPKGLW